eukprot:Blabericola_migrator_1__307@NODE_107_length_14077_cov_92_419629_g95_i0_p7_GENE_NODE_107_length_14077_cov_92_419629_g95_i0NODE_107_length_14077_cov_92_419629_g95_i0_p7_ORF_typecomplete_len331_score31_03RPA_C/PF08784_11/6_7e07Regulator_TrmB/PF11495_8/3e03Regulator_TrmB/PF11495_8/1_1e02Regulator_TrmB/PF11495_8/6_3_NODE_107_length_14077_cov_92_419629_g95_i01218613178
MFNFGSADAVPGGGGFNPGSFTLGFNGGESNYHPPLLSPMMAGTLDSYRKVCTPLKVGMIWRAYNTNPHAARIIVDGEEVGTLQVVGTLHNFQAIEDIGADKFTFDLCDGTGVIKVEWLIGMKDETKSDYEENVLRSFRAAAESGVPFFVSVYGEINLRAVAVPRIKALTCDRVTNAGEIFFHDLQIISIRLGNRPIHTRSSLNASDDVYMSPIRAAPQTPVRLNAKPTPQQPVHHAAQQPPVRSPISQPVHNRLSTSPTAGTNLPKKVYEFLEPMKETHTQGVHVRVITQHLAKEMPGLTVDAIKSALSALEDEGQAYFSRNPDMWCVL